MSQLEEPRGGDGGVHQAATAHDDATIIQTGRDLHIHYPGGVRRAFAAGGGLDTECPYPGLAAFTVEQAGWFFGREWLTADLLTRMNGCLTGGGPVMVVAPSGAGKSSLLRAGLLHRIAEGGLTPAGSRNWPQIVFTPAAHPMRRAADALRAELPDAIDGASAMAGPDDPGPEYLDGMLRQVVLAASGHAGSAARAVVVVDQFEELFTLCGSERERQVFISWLVRAAAHDLPGGPMALVACGLRADFYAECARYPQIRKALQANQILVGSMSPGELRQAITLPAEATGLDVEPGLVEVLLRDLRAGQADMALGGDDLAVDYDAGRLPLLAHALQATWLRRHGSTLTLDGYQATGGIEHAIAETANRVFRGLDDAGQHQVRSLFLRLVKVGASGVEDARRLVTRSDLTGGGSAAGAVVDAYISSRLLTAYRDAIQITHEALLRAWPRLSRWLEEDRPGNLIRQDLEDAAVAWSRQPGDKSLLYRGGRLEAAVTWAGEGDRELSGTAQAFLDASRQLARRTRMLQRTVATVISVFALLASAASVFAYQQRTSALEQRDQAIYNQIVSEALQLQAADSSLAAQLDLAAYRLQPTSDVASRLIGFENTPLPTPLTGLPAAIDSVAFSQEGRTMASGSSDGTVRLWNLADPTRPREIGPPLTAATGVIDSVAFSHDGKILALGSSDGTVRLWRVADPARPLSLAPPLTGSTDAVSAVAFSPAGSTLASASSDGTVRLWSIANLAAPRLLGQLLSGSAGAVNTIAFSPDRRTLAAGGSDGTVRLWNVANPARPRVLSPPQAGSAKAVETVAFSPDGRTLASGSSDGTIRLWNVANPANPSPLGPQLTGSTGAVESVAFSPDGRMFAFGSSDGAVRLWNVSDPANPRAVGPPLTGATAAVTSVAFSPDGRTLADGSADHSIWLWSLPRTVLTGDTAAVNTLAFSPDGRTLASGSTDLTVRLWNTADPARPQAVSTPLTGSTGTVDTVAFSPDGRTLASGSYDGAIRFWDVSDPGLPRALGPPVIASSGYVNSLAFSPDGHLLASGSADHTVVLWGTRDPASPFLAGPPLTGFGDTVSAVAFSPRGHTLAVGSYDGTVRLWNIADPATPRQVGQAMTGSIAYVLSIAFSPDGRELAVGSYDGTVRLWNVAEPANPRLLGGPLAGQAGPVNSISFSPDGHTLAIGSTDGTVRLWDVTTPANPQAIGQPLTGSGAPITSVSFSPDGHTLADGSGDGTIRLWDISITRAAQWICAAAGNALTLRQWHKDLPQLAYQPPCPSTGPVISPQAAASVTSAQPFETAPVDSVPAVPSGITARASGEHLITVTWTDTSRGIAGFNIDNGCPIIPVGVCGGSDASMTRTTGQMTATTFTVTPGTYQCFRVEAFNYLGASGWSGYGCAATEPLLISGKGEWTDSGVNLRTGDHLFIQASGHLAIGSATSAGPAGDPSCVPEADYPAIAARFPAPNLPCWSLVARIGSGPPFEVGTATLVTAADGRLYLRANGPSRIANSGAWQVRIKIGGPPP